jgi:hypothetical protein
MLLDHLEHRDVTVEEIDLAFQLTCQNAAALQPVTPDST